MSQSLVKHSVPITHVRDNRYTNCYIKHAGDWYATFNGYVPVVQQLLLSNVSHLTPDLSALYQTSLPTVSK